MLSQKAKYALKALFQLATSPPGTMMLVADIAAKENAPKKFLELILLDVKRHGLLRSQRGRGGGYALARPADSITFGEIIRITEGPLAPIPCASLTGYQRCTDCDDEDACAIRKVMRRVRDAMSEILDRTTLADGVAMGQGAEALIAAG